MCISLHCPWDVSCSFRWTHQMGRWIWWKHYLSKSPFAKCSQVRDAYIFGSNFNFLLIDTVSVVNGVAMLSVWYYLLGGKGVELCSILMLSFPLFWNVVFSLIIRSELLGFGPVWLSLRLAIGPDVAGTSVSILHNLALPEHARNATDLCGYAARDDQGKKE